MEIIWKDAALEAAFAAQDGYAFFVAAKAHSSTPRVHDDGEDKVKIVGDSVIVGWSAKFIDRQTGESDGLRDGAASFQVRTAGRTVFRLGALVAAQP